MFRGGVRGVHEGLARETVKTVLRKARGDLGDAAERAFVLRRDRLLRADVDSSQLNDWFLETLVREFPRARFLLTIRGRWAWCDSFINHSLSRPAPADWVALRRLRFGADRLRRPPEEGPLRRRGLYTLDGYFSHWAEQNRRVIDVVPADRLLIVPTHRLTSRAAEIVSLIGLPSSAVSPERSHSFQAPRRFGVLAEIDRDYLEAVGRRHGEALMRRYFPEEEHGLTATLGRSGAAGADNAGTLIAAPRPDGRGPRAGAGRFYVTPPPRPYAFMTTIHHRSDDAAAAGPPRVLIDNGSYHLRNVGDLAMLRATVDQLRRRRPGCRIDVLTSAPDRCRRALGDVEPVSVKERDDAERYAGRVRRADLVLAAGGGYFTDAFLGPANRVLDTLALARRLGRPTALLGQGLGPLTDRRMRGRLAGAVRGSVLTTLREEVAGRPLLRELGADGPQVLVTGDEAIGPAAALGPADAAAAGGDLLGLNVRASGYAGVGPEVEAALKRAIDAAVAAARARVQLVPISFYGRENDLRRTAPLVPAGRLAAGGADVAETPGAVAAAAGRCRALVTGSYHAGVFALSRGVPVVGIVASSYYDLKFRGLAAQFGPGSCVPLPVEGPDLPGRLTAAVLAAWETPRAGRAALFAAARRQAAACEAAYIRLLDGAGVSADLMQTGIDGAPEPC